MEAGNAEEIEPAALVEVANKPAAHGLVSAAMPRLVAADEMEDARMGQEFVAANDELLRNSPKARPGADN